MHNYNCHIVLIIDYIAVMSQISASPTLESMKLPTSLQFSTI